MTDHYEKFQDYNPQRKAKQLINDSLDAFEVMREYKPTLRTLFYQLVSDEIIDNTARAYNNLGVVLRKARDGGLFPWNALLDNNRNFNQYTIQDSVYEVLDDLQWELWFDIWSDQENYVEVWVEKDAQAGTVEYAANQYRVPWMACKGYLSATMAFNAGKRFKRMSEIGKKCHLVHLGDHDPSGIDMTRDNRKRLLKYSDMWFGDLEMHRIALNFDQVEEYNPPANGIDTGFKINDPRAQDYIADHGMVSWELDALKPNILVPIITEKLDQLIDKDLMDVRRYEEQQERKPLEWISNNKAETLTFVETQMETNLK